MARSILDMAAGTTAGIIATGSMVAGATELRMAAPANMAVVGMAADTAKSPDGEWLSVGTAIALLGGLLWLVAEDDVGRFNRQST
jgi:hypothetical protein